MIDAQQQQMYYDELKYVTTAREVSMLWGITTRHVYRLVDEGKIYGIRICNGHVVISLSSAHSFLGAPKTTIKRVSLDDLQDMVKAG